MFNVTQLCGFGAGANDSPYFVAAASEGTGNNPVAAVPAGYQAGDLLLIFATMNKGGFTTPGGWTADLLNGDGANTNLCVFRKIATASESSVTVTGNDASAIAVMACYRNANTTTPLDLIGSVTSTSLASIATTSITTTRVNDLVISAYAMVNPAATWTAPGSTNVRINISPTVTVCGILVCDEVQSVTGATTTRTATSSTTGKKSSVAVAYRP